jgi:hypothetical protein
VQLQLHHLSVTQLLIHCVAAPKASPRSETMSMRPSRGAIVVRGINEGSACWRWFCAQFWVTVAKRVCASSGVSPLPVSSWV